MLEEAGTDPTPTEPTEAPPTAQEVWDRVSAKQTPITKEEVKGEDPKGEAPIAIPDRVLVAPELAKFLEGNLEPEANPLEERLAAIEAALTPAPEAVSFDAASEVAALRAELAEKDAEAVAVRQSEANEAQFRTFKEGIIANLRADEEKYPGIIAAGFEDNVIATLVPLLEAKEAVSEDQVASKAEAKLRALYETLKGAYETSPPSEETTESSQEQESPTTLTPDLSAADEPVDIESLLKAGLSHRDAAAQVWDKVYK